MSAAAVRDLNLSIFTIIIIVAGPSAVYSSGLRHSNERPAPFQRAACAIPTSGLRRGRARVHVNATTGHVKIVHFCLNRIEVACR
jgi:hypothetical protein